jgi:hypothetical protein
MMKLCGVLAGLKRQALAQILLWPSTSLIRGFITPIPVIKAGRRP